MSDTANTPIPDPFPLALTARGEKLTPEELQVVMGHPTFHVLVELQEAVYSAFEAERKAEHALQAARNAAWDARMGASAALRRAFEEAWRERLLLEEQLERVKDAAELARVAGVLVPDGREAPEAYCAAVMAEQEALGALRAWEISQPPTSVCSAEVETARERRCTASEKYEQVVRLSCLNRFVADYPRAERPEEEAEEVEEVEEDQK